MVKTWPKATACFRGIGLFSMPASQAAPANVLRIAADYDWMAKE
jgi:hypothetical protein